VSPSSAPLFTHHKYLQIKGGPGGHVSWFVIEETFLTNLIRPRLVDTRPGPRSPFICSIHLHTNERIPIPTPNHCHSDSDSGGNKELALFPQKPTIYCVEYEAGGVIS
jgi:hypothetical protein